MPQSHEKYLPQRIICLTEETTETLYLLGEEARIVGVSTFTVRPARAKKEKPTVSSFIDAHTRKILDLKPDLVIGYSDIQATIAQELIKMKFLSLNEYIKCLKKIQPINFLNFFKKLLFVTL